MAFHYTRLGKFGGHLRHYADLNGMVPQEGDQPEDFSWPHDEFAADFSGGEGYEGYAAEQWAEHLSGCIAETAEAERELDEWRARNV